MNKTISITNLAKALLLFQSKMDPIKKDTTNPFFKKNYASLFTILNSIQIPLYECGLAFSQFPDGENGLTTILIHAESGEYIEATYSIHPLKNEPQAIGSALTYARRYAIGAILGLNIDEDDDGNGANDKPKTQSKNHPNAAPAAQILATPANGKPWLNENTDQWQSAIKFLVDGGLISAIEKKYHLGKTQKEKLIIEAANQF